jgi:CRISPR-associated protein Csm4
MRYLHGEAALKGFLELYDEGKPPLLVSNGFPGDLLPNPVVPPRSIEATLLLEQELEEQRKNFRLYKQIKASKHITLSEFNRAINGEMVLPSAEVNSGETMRVTLKNQLNRLSTTTDEAHPLYNFTEYYWPEITVYLKVADDFVDTVKELFQYIADTGYGKRKSVGYGQIELMSFDTFAGFNQPQKVNGFVTLSNFVPAANDPVAGWWNKIVKYGRMGEEWASEDNAFKKPLLMLEAGSTFLDPSPRDYYGCLVRNLNPAYSQTVQYAFALPVAMLVPGQETTL